VAASIPDLLGFKPQASLVVLGLGRDGGVRVTGRADLVDVETGDAAQAFVRMCRRAVVSQALLMCVVDEPVLAGRPLPSRSAALLVADALTAVGVRVLAGLCLYGDRLWVYDEPPRLPGLAGWPSQGVTVPAPDASPLAPDRVWRGEVLHPDRASMVSSVGPAPPGVRQAVSRALRRVDDRRTGAATRIAPQAPSPDQVRAADLRVWGQAVARSEQGALPGTRQTAHLLHGVSDILTRDLIIVSTWSGQVGVCLPLTVHLARVAPAGWVAPAAGLLAWFAYADGRGALAAAAAVRALDDDPSHRLAALVQLAVRQALPPALLERVVDAAAEDLAARIDPTGPLGGWQRWLAARRDPLPDDPSLG